MQNAFLSRKMRNFSRLFRNTIRNTFAIFSKLLFGRDGNNWMELATCTVRVGGQTGRFCNGAQSAAAAGVRCNHGKCAFLRANLLAFSNSPLGRARNRDHLHTAAMLARGDEPAAAAATMRPFGSLSRTTAVLSFEFRYRAKNARPACESTA